jgi:hypothetical protein
MKPEPKITVRFVRSQECEACQARSLTRDVARTLGAPWKLCESHLAVVRRANDEAKTDAVSPTFSEEQVGRVPRSI